MSVWDDIKEFFDKIVEWFNGLFKKTMVVKLVVKV